jgi:multidrug efflux pump subunit AcrA (membrane-fusion protein)
LISQIRELQKKSAGAEGRCQDAEAARDTAVKAKEDSDSRLRAQQVELEQLRSTYESLRQALNSLTLKAQSLEGSLSITQEEYKKVAREAKGMFPGFVRLPPVEFQGIDALLLCDLAFFSFEGARRRGVHEPQAHSR